MLLFVKNCNHFETKVYKVKLYFGAVKCIPEGLYLLLTSIDRIIVGQGSRIITKIKLLFVTIAALIIVTYSNIYMLIACDRIFYTAIYRSVIVNVMS